MYATKSHRRRRPRGSPAGLLLSLGLLASVTAAVGLGGCKSESTSSGVSKTVVVGTEPAYPPFETRGPNGEFEGFDMDLVRAVGQRAGFEVQFKDMGFDALIPALGAGQVQMIASALSITDERRKVVDFSDPYVEAGLGLTVRMNETAVKGVADLAGKTVAVQSATTGAMAAEKLKAEGKLANIKYFPSAPLAILELTRGGVDAVINDRPASEAYLAQVPGQGKLLAEVIQSDSYGLAVRKGNAELLAKVNDALRQLKADGTIDRLKAKHFKNSILAATAPSSLPATVPATPMP